MSKFHFPSRKITSIRATHILCFINIFIFIYNPIDSFFLALFTRFFIGLSISINIVATNTFIAETVPPNKTGFYVSLYESGVTLGILLSYVANFVLTVHYQAIIMIMSLFNIMGIISLHYKIKLVFNQFDRFHHLENTRTSSSTRHSSGSQKPTRNFSTSSNSSTCSRKKLMQKSSKNKKSSSGQKVGRRKTSKDSVSDKILNFDDDDLVVLGFNSPESSPEILLQSEFTRNALDEHHREGNNSQLHKQSSKVSNKSSSSKSKQFYSRKRKSSVHKLSNLRTFSKKNLVKTWVTTSKKRP